MASVILLDDSRSYQIEVPCIVFFILTPSFVALRLWARAKLRGWQGIGLDDWSIVASSIFATIVSGLMMGSCAYGFGQHMASLRRPNKLMTLKLFYVAQAFYKLSINMTKLSILLLYLRIFPSRWFRISCHLLIGVILTYMIATTAASIWQCTPVPRAWDKSISGTCISITANWYSNAAFSIVTDVIILALPMYPIFTSKLPKSQKLALMAVFALGLFTTITSILRMQTLSFSSKSPDITYDIDSSVWTMIEIHLAIICACLPMFRLPLAYILPSYFSESASPASSDDINNNHHHHHHHRRQSRSAACSSCYPASCNRKSKRIAICPLVNGSSSSTKDLELQVSHHHDHQHDDDDDDDVGITGRGCTPAASASLRTQSMEEGEDHHPGTRVVLASSPLPPRGSAWSSDGKVVMAGEQEVKRNVGVELAQVSPGPPPPRSLSFHS
ncbi:putative integral membrane protein [Cladorrhinum samala]|uniref:Integral membrane protein n=1 Tax=Cladorrhinum samala TaxID=585594 RepID=A0AAV9HZC8_9PEZI|nr:putative integral membrane protein [Cladorrhinum samala]